MISIHNYEYANDVIGARQKQKMSYAEKYRRLIEHIKSTIAHNPRKHPEDTHWKTSYRFPKDFPEHNPMNVDYDPVWITKDVYSKAKKWVKLVYSEYALPDAYYKLNVTMYRMRHEQMVDTKDLAEYMQLLNPEYDPTDPGYAKSEITQKVFDRVFKLAIRQ